MSENATRGWQALGAVLGLGVAAAIALIGGQRAAVQPTMPPAATPVIRGAADGSATAQTPERPQPLAREPRVLAENARTHPSSAALGVGETTPSVSVGTPQTGHLQAGVDIAARPSPVIRILGPTRTRGYTFGTGELVALLQDCAAALAAAFPGTALQVANLSRPGGGDIPQSVSHNSGRDADVAFFARTTDGQPAPVDAMVRFDDAGIGTRADGVPVRFDVARNWTLVRHLLSHPAVVVQWIFIAAPLRNMLLDHALRLDEPELLRERARRVLVQPGDSSRHDDHMHVRIACPTDDRPGCIDGAGRTASARDAQIDTLLRMYESGSPAEKRYARDMLSLPVDGENLTLPPKEGDPELP